MTEALNEEIKQDYIMLDPKIIIDHFYHRENKILILDPFAFKKIVDKDLLILAKEIITEKGVAIEPLTEEEYEDAVRKYEALVELISNGNQEGGDDE